MGAEDFAYYLDRVPGALLRLGIGMNRPALHTPAYDFSDEAMENGIVTLVALALETLATAS
jgi:metal-dependent amidase/aminoacylase/carboxypeptidase family protein